MNTVGYILSFAGGCLVGALATYRLATDKAEERADMEIAEMERYFQTRYEKKKKAVVVDEDVKKKAEAAHNKPDIREVRKQASDALVNYTAYSEPDPDDAVIYGAEPVILHEEDEFGEDESYNRVYLEYYDDDILADSITRKVYNRKETEESVGLQAIAELDTLTGDGQPRDLVWVRNDKYKTYFQIERSYQEYTDSGLEDDEY